MTIRMYCLHAALSGRGLPYKLAGPRDNVEADVEVGGSPS